VIDFFASMELYFKEQPLLYPNKRRFTCKEDFVDFYTEELENISIFHRNMKFYIPSIDLSLRSREIIKYINHFIEKYRLEVEYTIIEDDKKENLLFSNNDHYIIRLKGIHAYYVMDVAVTLDRVITNSNILSGSEDPFDVIKSAPDADLSTIFYKGVLDLNSFIEYVNSFRNLMGRQDRDKFTCYYSVGVFLFGNNGVMSFYSEFEEEELNEGV